VQLDGLGLARSHLRECLQPSSRATRIEIAFRRQDRRFVHVHLDRAAAPLVRTTGFMSSSYGFVRVVEINLHLVRAMLDGDEM
jgi:hypothetical protein